MEIIAHIKTDLPEKFGVPRQSGVVPSLTGRIIFEPEYRNPDAIRGMEEFDYLWLLWRFDVDNSAHNLTVRPPRLGGNERRGVFATRSPFRPNPIGLSSVKIESIAIDPDLGPVITVSGIDMRDNTAIYDIKPYLAYADAHPDASNGFAGEHLHEDLEVSFPPELLSKIPADKQEALLELLSEDPRPHYQKDPARVYGVSYAGFNIQFRVCDNHLLVMSVM